MTRLRRLALTVLVGVLVTLPTAGSALAQLPTTNDPRVGLSPGFDNPSVAAASGRFAAMDWEDDWFSDFEEGDGEDFLDEDQARRAGPRAYTATVGIDSRTRDFVDNLEIYLLPNLNDPTAAPASLSVSGSTGSSHREAPNILKDPTSDNTDVYAVGLGSQGGGKDDVAGYNTKAFVV